MNLEPYRGFKIEANTDGEICARIKFVEAAEMMDPKNFGPFHATESRLETLIAERSAKNLGTPFLSHALSSVRMAKQRACVVN